MNTFMLLFLICLTFSMCIHGCLKERKYKKHRGSGHVHGGSILSVDYYAYASSLRKWNAAFKAVFAMICLLLCIAFNNMYVSVIVILVMGYLTVVIGGLSFHHYVSMMLIPIVFLLFGSLAIAVSFSIEEPTGQYYLWVFHLFYVSCSAASLFKAAGLILKALGAVSALYMLTLTTPMGELITVLQKIHIPKILIELMYMIYRYIFIMLDTHSRMKNSAESRLGYVDFKTSCYSFGQIASNLFIISLKRGNAYYNALESRCYEGELHFLEEKKPIRKIHIAVSTAFVLFLVMVWILTKEI